MNTKDVTWVDMYGPSLRDPNVTVNRKVAEADIQAYVAAGYKKGTDPDAVDAAKVKAPKVEAPKAPEVKDKKK